MSSFTIMSQGAIRLSPVGMTIRDGVTLSEWEQLGDELAKAHVAMQWAIGDWLLYGEGRPEWGDGYRAAVARFGKKYQTLANYKHIAKAFEFSRRRENLSWAHHAEVASLDPGEQDRLLDEASPADDGEKPRLSRADLRKRVQPQKAPATIHSLTNRVRNAVEQAAEVVSPEQVDVLQNYVASLAEEVSELAQPVPGVDGKRDREWDNWKRRERDRAKRDRERAERVHPDGKIEVKPVFAPTNPSKPLDRAKVGRAIKRLLKYLPAFQRLDVLLRVAEELRPAPTPVTERLLADSIDALTQIAAKPSSHIVNVELQEVVRKLRLAAAPHIAAASADTYDEPDACDC